MKQEISPTMIGVAIALVVVILGGAIWLFMSKTDQSGPDHLNKVTPGTPQRAMRSGGESSSSSSKGGGSASQ